MASTDIDLSLPGPGFQVFDTLELFYAAERRARSGEVDFGVWWTLPGQRWPHWRVSWVCDTGEVYAVAQTTPKKGPVVVRGGFPTRESVEAALEGWTDHCHLDGLGWLWERLAAQMVGLMETYDFTLPDEEEFRQAGQQLLDMARHMAAARGLTAVGVFSVFMLTTDEGSLVTAILGPTRGDPASQLVRKLIDAVDETISEFNGEPGVTVVPTTDFRGDIA